jgi:hypothetical protein
MTTRNLILEEKDPYAELVKAGKDVERQPSDGQKEAGNYAKGHLWICGFHVAIENPKGSVRSGKDGNGKEWRVRMPCYYGYIKGTEGKDKDHIDVYIGPDPECETVYVVDQVNEKGGFDEHKIMLGFPTREKALECYDAAFSDGKGPERRGAVTGMSLADLRQWLKSGKTKEPVALTEADAKKLLLSSDWSELVDFIRAVIDKLGYADFLINTGTDNNFVDPDLYGDLEFFAENLDGIEPESFRQFLSDSSGLADSLREAKRLLANAKLQLSPDATRDWDTFLGQFDHWILMVEEAEKSVRESRVKKLILAQNMPNERELERFFDAYIEAALWSSSDDDGVPLDQNYDVRDFDPKSLAQQREEANAFATENYDDIEDDLRRAGHDFWLTRNGHGAGFWDGDWPDDVGDRLTEASKRYGEVYIYAGDDGQLYT